MKGRILEEFTTSNEINKSCIYIPQMRINNQCRRIVSESTVLYDSHMAEVILQNAIKEYEKAMSTLEKYRRPDQAKRFFEY